MPYPTYVAPDWVNLAAPAINEARMDAISIALANAAGGMPIIGVKAFGLSYGGSAPTTQADMADFYVPVTQNCILMRMRVVCKTPPSGAMVVQLRRSVNNGTSFANVAGFQVTFGAGARVAVVDPADVAVTEGDLLNFSITAAGAGADSIVVMVMGMAVVP